MEYYVYTYVALKKTLPQAHKLTSVQRVVANTTLASLCTHTFRLLPAIGTQVSYSA